MVSRAFLALLLLPVVFILAADIPWFLHNYARLSTSALLWMDDAGFAAGMVLGERSFQLYVLPFLGGYALALYGIRPLPPPDRTRPVLWREAMGFALCEEVCFSSACAAGWTKKAPTRPERPTSATTPS